MVDDDRLCRSLLQDALCGWGHEVLCAEDGAQAWERLEADRAISLVITDWVMPRLDGLELCRRIRAAEFSPYLPVLLSTSRNEEEEVAQGLAAGADAFLTKPLHLPTLRAQLRVAERILQLEERLESRLRCLAEAHERIRRDLEAAAAVQRAHLPERPPSLGKLEFAWAYEACETLGGDMFNVFRLDESHVGIYVLDVSGHGTAAALLSVSLSRALVPHPQQGGILKQPRPAPPYYEILAPAEVAAELNRRFPLIDEAGRFCTLLYGILDVASHRFRYVSAGHPDPIVVLGEHRLAQRGAGGPPIGVLQDAGWEEIELQLAPGSRLLLYTDGASEAANERGERFGEERLLAAIAGARDGEAPGIAGTIARLRAQLAAFGGGRPPHDDVTLLGLEIA